jgi:hypothetical protein
MSNRRPGWLTTEQRRAVRDALRGGFLLAEDAPAGYPEAHRALWAQFAADGSVPPKEEFERVVGLLSSGLVAALDRPDVLPETQQKLRRASLAIGLAWQASGCAAEWAE